MFSPIKPGPPIDRSLMWTYDGEWSTDNAGYYVPRLFGAYHPEHGYFPFYGKGSPALLLEWALSPSQNGASYWGHYAGKADMAFLLPVLRKLSDAELFPIYSGSSLIMLTVKIGKREYYFKDSFLSFHCSLKDVAKAFTKHAKVKVDNIEDENTPISVLEERNRLDCVILWDGIVALEDIWREKGGAMKLTGAASALHLFRCKYLKRPIRNHQMINMRLRPWYVGGRVEPYKELQESEEAESVDIVSSYPGAMKTPLPGNLKSSHLRKLPTREDAIFYADVTVKVRPHMGITPLPIRLSSRVFFPTGTFRGWFAAPELRLPGVEIVKVHEVFEFEPCLDWTAYIDDMFATKKAAAKGTALYNWAKHGMNDPYGKLAQNPIRTTISFSPPPKKIEEYEILQPGVYRFDITTKVAHQWVPMAGYITSIGRCNWFYGASIIAPHADIMYGDTDSIKADGRIPRGLLSEGKEAGQWEREKCEHKDDEDEAPCGAPAIATSSRFVGCKIYYQRYACGHDVVRAKGMGGKLTTKDIDNYADGVGLENSRPARIKELLSMDDDSPRLIKTVKVAAGPNHPKKLKPVLQKRNGRDAWDYEELVSKLKRERSA